MESMELESLRQFYEGKRVFVTGDTGFKGSWMSIWLREMGAIVFGYALPAENENWNFERCDLRNKITHLDGDIRNFQSLKDYLLASDPEIVFHLAAQPIVIDSYEDPRTTFDTNVVGLVNLLEVLRSLQSVKAVVNVTSDKSYENQGWSYLYRENDPLGGDDPYSASKACSEIISRSYYRSFFQGKMGLATARAGNVIGGGDWSSHRIMPDILRAYKSGGNLALRKPKATRPWQFVLEPLFGYLILAKKLCGREELFSDAWNFGPNAGKNRTVMEIVNELKKVWDIHVEFQSESSFKETDLLQLDISKSMTKLGWAPRLDFNEMLRMTVEGYLAEEKKGDIYESRVSQIAQYLEG